MEFVIVSCTALCKLEFLTAAIKDLKKFKLVMVDSILLLYAQSDNHLVAKLMNCNKFPVLTYTYAHYIFVSVNEFLIHISGTNRYYTKYILEYLVRNKVKYNTRNSNEKTDDYCYYCCYYIAMVVNSVNSPQNACINNNLCNRPRNQEGLVYIHTLL